MITRIDYPRHRLSILAFILLFSCSHPATPPDSPADNRTIALADSLLHFNPGRADSIYRRMLADSSDGYTPEMVKCLIGLAQVYSGRSTFDTALILINQAVSISVSAGDTALIIHSLIGKGNFYLDLGDQNKAESSFRDALMLAQQAGRKKEQHVLFLCLGSIQQESGRYSEAITTFTESVTLAEQDGNIQNQALALENIGLIMINTGDFREALVYLNRAQVLRDQANLRRESAMGLMNLGILYRRMNLPDSSLTCYLKASKVFTEMNDSNNLVKVRYNTGLILKNQGKYDQAREIMEQVLVICRKKGIIDGEVYTLHTLAAIFDEEGRIAEGLRYADSAIALAKERGLTRNLPHFLKRKEELLANAGNYSEAYATALEVTAISDSLLSLDKQKEISRLITRFETSRKEAENTLLKQDLRMQRARMIWLWFIFILGLLVFLLMVLIFRFRFKHLKQQQVLSEEKALRQAQTTRNNELELEKSRLESDLKETHIQKLEYQARLREQELVWQTLMRADLTNINRSVQEKLFPFGLRLSRKKDQEEFRRSLDELTRDAAREPLAEFEQTFRQLHPSFVENLLKGYPDLNKSEILISSLIRLNLSSKEIARLLNLSLATIETTRYHIRKKLSLNSSENLTAFLIQL